METKSQRGNKLPVYPSCGLEGYDAAKLMVQTMNLKLITRRGTLEMLIPLCCSTEPVRYKQFRQLPKGFSRKALARRLKELEKAGFFRGRRTMRFPKSRV